MPGYYQSCKYEGEAAKGKDWPFAKRKKDVCSNDQRVAARAGCMRRE